jgi:hypothetical protein
LLSVAQVEGVVRIPYAGDTFLDVSNGAADDDALGVEMVGISEDGCRRGVDALGKDQAHDREKGDYNDRGRAPSHPLASALTPRGPLDQ